MKLVYQYMVMVISFNFSPTSSRLHPLQVENCDSNSRLVVDEDGKFRIERVKIHVVHEIIYSILLIIIYSFILIKTQNCESY